MFCNVWAPGSPSAEINESAAKEAVPDWDRRLENRGSGIHFSAIPPTLTKFGTSGRRVITLDEYGESDSLPRGVAAGLLNLFSAPVS
jgi:hypothetical protein